MFKLTIHDILITFNQIFQVQKNTLRKKLVKEKVINLMRKKLFLLYCKKWISIIYPFLIY